MSRILSLDISLTSTGYAVAVDGKITDQGVILGKHEDVPRLIHNRNRICDRVETASPDLIIFEDLAHSRNESYAKEIAGLTYMIRAELVTDKIRYILVAPNSLKKFCCGSGGSKKNPIKKEHVIKDLYKRFGHDVNDNNIADAIVLAYIGMALLGEWTPIIQPQHEVLTTIRGSNPGFPIPESVSPRQIESPKEDW